MEQFHWSQKQLYEDTTLEMVHKIGEYNSINSKAEKIREAKEKAQRGGR